MAVDPYKFRFGSWGEGVAASLLEQDGFTDVEPLNLKKRNHKGGDLRARRDGKSWFFSVKARDRLGKNGRENPSYNIYPSKVIAAAQAYGDIPCWLTIKVDKKTQTYSAYWGLVSEIPVGSHGTQITGVKMTGDILRSYRPLAHDILDLNIRDVFKGKEY